MADVRLNHVYKVYDGGVKAVSDFNIDIKDKEFIVFVGPSGCGKSTTLRMIAGLEDITAGDLFIDNQLVNDVQPKDRDIAMVFQNYALYPHMTVYENMAFSLKNRHMPKEEINRRVLEAARILDIEQFLQRKPKAMSGGQRQRVSLGRAIVRQPKVFLLDEPLSNLDAKLRAQMRTEIAKLHKKLATTFIYVTHDQVEAMTMGTRIVVMKLGFVQQIDTPTNLYEHPVNKFVAGFIGTPQMNFFNVTLKRNKDLVTVTLDDKQQSTLNISNFYKCNPEYLNGDINLTLGVRCDGLEIVKSGNGFDLIVSEIEALGNETLLYCDLANLVVKDKDKIVKSSIIVKVDPSSTYKVGDKIKVNFKNNKIHLFDNETEMTVMPYMPTSTYQTISFKGDNFTLFGKTYKRFSAWRNIPDGENYKIEIPHAAIVPGKAYTLKVVSCEKTNDNKYLVVLANNADDSFITVVSDAPFAKDQDFSFGLKYADLILDKKLGIDPVTKETSVVGEFIKVKEVDDKDYNLVKEIELSNNERRKMEMNVSKTYLTLEQYGADKELHQHVLDAIQESLNSSEVNLKSMLDKRSELVKQIKDLQSKTDYTEPLYLSTKNELLLLDKNIRNIANTAFNKALESVRLVQKTTPLITEQDKETVTKLNEEILERFTKEVKPILDKVPSTSKKFEVYKTKLANKLNSMFLSHKLFAEKETKEYFDTKLSDYQSKENLVIDEEVKSDLFTTEASENTKKTNPNRFAKLMDQIYDSYKYAISATYSYVRGLYLGNSTRWHKDANKNADEIFGKYLDLHELHINDFKLCNLKQTSDYKLKKVYNYYIKLCGSKFRLSDEMIARLTNIEGSRLLKNKYRFVFKPLVENLTKPGINAVNEQTFDGRKLTDKVNENKGVTAKLPQTDLVSENMATTEIRKITQVDLSQVNPTYKLNSKNLDHNIISISNYGSHTFAKVQFLPEFVNESNYDVYGKQINDIEITGLDNADDYYISVDDETGFEIYTLDTKIRIA